MPHAAVDVRSPIVSPQSTPSSSTPQKSSSSYPFNFAATSSSDLLENQRNPTPSSFDAATECNRGASFGPSVSRAGSRARPRLAKVRKQQTKSRVAANEVGSSSNPFEFDLGRVADRASLSSGASESSNAVSNGSTASKDFCFPNGDIKSVELEGASFVFGANRIASEANVGSEVRGIDGCVRNSGSEDRGKVKVENGKQLRKTEHVSFVFGAKQSDFESLVVGDEGNVQVESVLERGKFHNLGFVFDADQNNLALNTHAEKREHGECVDKSVSKDIRKMKLETETECGNHNNPCHIFSDSQHDLSSNLNLDKAGCGGNSEKPDYDEDKINLGTETLTKKYAGQSDLGSIPITEKGVYSENLSVFGCEDRKHGDVGFVFGSCWSSSPSKNLEKGVSAETCGKLGTAKDGGKVEVKSGEEFHKVKATAVNFHTDGDRSLNNPRDTGIFVFGSGNTEPFSFSECMSLKCPGEMNFNNAHLENGECIKTQISELGSDVEGKANSVFGGRSNVASTSSTSSLFKLPDEMQKMKIDDSDNFDGTDKIGRLNENSCANSGGSFTFERSENASGSFDTSSATGASSGIFSSKPFSFHDGLSNNTKVSQLPQDQASDDDTQQNAFTAPSSFSSIGVDSQPKGSASETDFIDGLENKDGNCHTSIPVGLGVPFTDFTSPKWDPSCFKGNLFPEINKNLDSSVKRRSTKDKRSNNMRGKLRPSSVTKQKYGKDNIPQETNSENPDSPGCCSPMDFSPYQETTVADPYSREASATSEEFSYVDNGLTCSGPHSTVLNDSKDEALATAEGLVANTSYPKCRERNEENFCCHNGSSFACNYPSRGFFSGAETTCSNTKAEQLCGSSGTGVMSAKATTGLNSNTEGKENNCRTYVHSASILEDATEKYFTFSALSSEQGGLSGRRRQQSKKSRGKVGRDSSIIYPSTTVDNQSSSSHLDTEDKSEAQPKQGQISFSAAIQETCDKLRLRGNQAYKNWELSKAEDLYTQGIICVPSSERSGCCLRPLLLCYSNRAATRMSLSRIREALGDCVMAIALDPNFLKAQMRAANCHLVLGEVGDALRCFNYCLESGAGICLDRKVILEAADGLQKTQKVAECTNQAAKVLEQKTSDAALSALEIIAEALSISLYSEKLLEMKAEALCMLRKYEEAIQLCEQTLSFAENNFASLSNAANAEDSGCESLSAVRLWRWCLISKCYFHQGRLEASLDVLQKLEQVGSTKVKGGIKTLELSISLAVSIRELLRCKNAGNEAYRSRKYTEAIEYYTIALSTNIESRPFAAICLCNRAAAHQALGQTADAIADCSLAIALDGNYAKAVSRRATLYEMIRDYGQAAGDLQRLISIHENQSDEKAKQSGTTARSASSVKELRQAQRHLPSMEEEAKRGIPLDFYLILGIKPSDTASDIKKAYRKAALRHHPDKAGQFLARSESGDEGRLWKEISQEVHKDADRLFKMIGEAYAVLSDPAKRSEYDLEEDMRKTPMENYGSRSYRRTSNAHSSPCERSASRGNWRENWKTYGNSHSRWLRSHWKRHIF